MMVLAPEYLGSKKASIVYRARKAGKPVAVVLTVVAPNGYSGPIVLLVGIDYSGDITGVRVVKHRETPGLGDAIEIERSDWIERFTGKSRRNPGRAGWKVKRDGGEFDQLTGATITPRAVVAAVSGALEYFEHNRDNLFISNAEIQARDEEAKGLQQ
jgi:electron transport complex protein RnfG